MKRFLKSVLLWGFALTGLYWLLTASWLWTTALLPVLSSLTDMNLSAERLGIFPWEGRFELSGGTLGYNGKSPFVTIDSAILKTGRLGLGADPVSLDIDGFHILSEEGTDGSGNFPSGKKQSRNWAGAWIWPDCLNQSNVSVRRLTFEKWDRAWGRILLSDGSFEGRCAGKAFEGSASGVWRWEKREGEEILSLPFAWDFNGTGVDSALHIRHHLSSGTLLAKPLDVSDTARFELSCGMSLNTHGATVDALKISSHFPDDGAEALMHASISFDPLRSSTLDIENLSLHPALAGHLLNILLPGWVWDESSSRGKGRLSFEPAEGVWRWSGEVSGRNLQLRENVFVPADAPVSFLFRQDCAYRSGVLSVGRFELGMHSADRERLTLIADSPFRVNLNADSCRFERAPAFHGVLENMAASRLTPLWQGVSADSRNVFENGRIAVNFSAGPDDSNPSLCRISGGGELFSASGRTPLLKFDGLNGSFRLESRIAPSGSFELALDKCRLKAHDKALAEVQIHCSANLPHEAAGELSFRGYPHRMSGLFNDKPEARVLQEILGDSFFKGSELLASTAFSMQNGKLRAPDAALSLLKGDKRCAQMVLHVEDSDTMPRMRLNGQFDGPFFKPLIREYIPGRFQKGVLSLLDSGVVQGMLAFRQDSQGLFEMERFQTVFSDTQKKTFMEVSLDSPLKIFPGAELCSDIHFSLSAKTSLSELEPFGHLEGWTDLPVFDSGTTAQTHARAVLTPGGEVMLSEAGLLLNDKVSGQEFHIDLDSSGKKVWRLSEGMPERLCFGMSLDADSAALLLPGWWKARFRGGRFVFNGEVLKVNEANFNTSQDRSLSPQKLADAQDYVVRGEMSLDKIAYRECALSEPFSAEARFVCKDGEWFEFKKLTIFGGSDCDTQKVSSFDLRISETAVFFSNMDVRNGCMRLAAQAFNRRFLQEHCRAGGELSFQMSGKELCWAGNLTLETDSFLNGTLRGQGRDFFPEEVVFNGSDSVWIRLGEEERSNAERRAFHLSFMKTDPIQWTDALSGLWVSEKGVPDTAWFWVEPLRLWKGPAVELTVQGRCMPVSGSDSSVLHNHWILTPGKLALTSASFQDESGVLRASGEMRLDSVYAPFRLKLFSPGWRLVFDTGNSGGYVEIRHAVAVLQGEGVAEPDMKKKLSGALVLYAGESRLPFQTDDWWIRVVTLPLGLSASANPLTYPDILFGEQDSRVRFTRGGLFASLQDGKLFIENLSLNGGDLFESFDMNGSIHLESGHLEHFSAKVWPSAFWVLSFRGTGHWREPEYSLLGSAGGTVRDNIENAVNVPRLLRRINPLQGRDFTLTASQKALIERLLRQPLQPE